MSIDYGQKKLGIAISDNKRIMAMPYKVIQRSNIKADIKALLTIIEGENVTGLVIGLPVSMSNEYTKHTEAVIKFADMIAVEANLPIFLQDERFSTKLAQNIMIAHDIGRKKRDQLDDKIAASYILETTLNLMRSSG
jgi:putative Holliday junction resolvase